jgi:pimeloyl-ACP methyl ester carboxylesterase
MGFSLGGGVALRTAIQHPEVVDRLVLVSTPFKRSGWYSAMEAAMVAMGPATPSSSSSSWAAASVTRASTAPA